MPEQPFDRYYMDIAKAVEAGSKCIGTNVGAVVVQGNRIVSTGYNGTPSGFPNCDEESFGCVRCKNSYLAKSGREEEMTDPTHVSGQALDKCICLHAEQNAILAAAKHGIRLEGGVLYTTFLPCFTCLKESVQVGISRIVYENQYKMGLEESMKSQYIELCQHVGGAPGVPRFERIGGGNPTLD